MYAFFTSVEKRNCYFSDETQTIKLHRNYSQANCYLECTIFYGQKKLRANSSQGCTPWFYPFIDEGHRMCNPWENSAFVQGLSNEMPIEECQHCISGEMFISLRSPELISTSSAHCYCSSINCHVMISRFNFEKLCLMRECQ